MMEEKIVEYVANKRSSTKLLNNMVNLNVSAEDSSTQRAMSVINELAQKHEAFKIKNEKNSLLIELGKKDQEFQAKFLNDPSVYNDQEKFDGMIKEYARHIKDKRSLIASSKYLTKQDVDNMIGSQEISDGEILNNLQYKRNQMFIKESYDTAILNLKQLEDIGSNIDSSNKEMFGSIINGINDTSKALKLAGISDAKIAAMIGETIAGMEFNRDFKELMPILNNPGLSYEEKNNYLKRYKSNISSVEYSKLISEKYNNKFGFSGDSFEIFKQSFLAKGSKINSGQDSSFNFLERSLKKQYKNALTQQKIAEKEAKKQKAREEKIRKSINNNDVYGYVENRFDEVPTTKEFVGDNYLLEETFDTSLSEIGDINNRDVVDIVSKGDLNSLKQQIAGAAAEGKSDSEIINEIIEPYADDIAGNDGYKKTAILKNLGMKLKGYSPVLLLNHKSDPGLVTTNRSYTVGKNAKKEIAIENASWLDDTLSRDNARTRYRNLNQRLGNGTIAKEKLNTLIVGKMKESGYTKFGPIDVESYLEDDTAYTDLVNSLPALQKLQISPVNYRLKKIRTDNLTPLRTSGPGPTNEEEDDGGFTKIRR